MSAKKLQAEIIKLDHYRMRRLVDDNFYDTLHVSKGVSLVIFTSAGCASCRAWKQVLQNYLQTEPELVVFEVDAHESMALANEYEIFHLPALFLFRDGQYHCELNCEANIERIRKAIGLALRQPAQEEP